MSFLCNCFGGNTNNNDEGSAGNGDDDHPGEDQTRRELVDAELEEGEALAQDGEVQELEAEEDLSFYSMTKWRKQRKEGWIKKEVPTEISFLTLNPVMTDEAATATVDKKSYELFEPEIPSYLRRRNQSRMTAVTRSNRRLEYGRKSEAQCTMTVERSDIGEASDTAEQSGLWSGKRTTVVGLP